jgi:hypothetical protein
MQYTKLMACASGAVLAIALACSKNSPAPVAPTGAEPGETEAAADGSTLKATAPTPQSPVNNAQPDQLVFTAGTSSARFASGMTFSYVLEIKNAGGQTVCTAGPTAASGPTVTITPTCTIDFDAPHTWRMRATQQGANGPWSAAASFRSPSGGYIRGNEVFDPLTNGRTVGEPVGPITFIPGVGVRLEDFGSHIRYRLPQTLSNGEFSIIITGMTTNTEGDKTKVMAMSQGLDDLITNDRRMTVEKRGDPPGIVAWRLITHDDQVDTEGSEREFVEFDASQSYLFTATWNGVFNVRIQRGGSGGPTIYNKGKQYHGRPYDPDPHYAFIGAPSGRSGITAATVPGMIVRNVWISPRPRPAGLD